MIDNSIFLLIRGKNLLIVSVDVDDIIFGSTLNSICKDFAKFIGSEFEISMMGELKFFLRLKMNQTSDGVLISQQKCILELLKQYKMEDSKPINTIIGTSTKLDKDDLGPSVNDTLYQGIIVSLL